MKVNNELKEKIRNIDWIFGKDNYPKTAESFGKNWTYW